MARRKSKKKSCRGKPWKKYEVGSKAYMAAIRKRKGCGSKRGKKSARRAESQYKKTCRAAINAALKRRGLLPGKFKKDSRSRPNYSGPLMSGGGFFSEAV